jgi:valyl-tRNA synthetase
VTDRANEFAKVQEIIGQIRNMRAEMKLDPKKRVAAEIYSSDPNIRDQVERSRSRIVRLGLLSELQVAAQKLSQTGGLIRSTGQLDVRIPYAADTVDVAAELTRLKKEFEGLQKAIHSKENQLSNDTFRSKAPEKIIQQMEEALAAQRIESQKLIDRLRQLEG